jgi:hypothetical protein
MEPCDRGTQQPRESRDARNERLKRVALLAAYTATIAGVVWFIATRYATRQVGSAAQPPRAKGRIPMPTFVLHGKKTD